MFKPLKQPTKIICITGGHFVPYKQVVVVVVTPPPSPSEMCISRRVLARQNLMQTADGPMKISCGNRGFLAGNEVTAGIAVCSTYYFERFERCHLKPSISSEQGQNTCASHFCPCCSMRCYAHLFCVRDVKRRTALCVNVAGMFAKSSSALLRVTRTLRLANNLRGRLFTACVWGAHVLVYSEYGVLFGGPPQRKLVAVANTFWCSFAVLRQRSPMPHRTPDHNSLRQHYCLQLKCSVRDTQEICHLPCASRSIARSITVAKKSATSTSSS